MKAGKLRDHFETKTPSLRVHSQPLRNQGSHLTKDFYPDLERGRTSKPEGRWSNLRPKKKLLKSQIWVQTLDNTEESCDYLKRTKGSAKKGKLLEGCDVRASPLRPQTGGSEKSLDSNRRVRYFRKVRRYGREATSGVRPKETKRGMLDV